MPGSRPVPANPFTALLARPDARPAANDDPSPFRHAVNPVLKGLQQLWDTPLYGQRFRTLQPPPTVLNQALFGSGFTPPPESSRVIVFTNPSVPDSELKPEHRTFMPRTHPEQLGLLSLMVGYVPDDPRPLKVVLEVPDRYVLLGFPKGMVLCHWTAESDPTTVLMRLSPQPDWRDGLFDLRLATSTGNIQGLPGGPLGFPGSREFLASRIPELPRYLEALRRRSGP